MHAIAVLMAPGGVCGMTGTPDVVRSYGSRFLPPSSWLHRRDVVDSCGTWPLSRVESGNAVDLAFQRRLFLAGMRFACCPQLSVVKFPSARWRLYAHSGEHPEAALSAQLARDPEALRSSLYREIALTYGREYENIAVLPALRRAKQAIYLAIRDWYGIDRWPLRQILDRRLRRTIKSHDRGRGLKPDDLGTSPDSGSADTMRKNPAATPEL